MVFMTRIRPSQFISDNPSREELQFMYQWLINSARNRNDYDRVKELQEKYNKITVAETINIFSNDLMLRALIIQIAAKIPRLNRDNNYRNVWTGKALSDKDIFEIMDNESFKPLQLTK